MVVTSRLLLWVVLLALVESTPAQTVFTVDYHEGDWSDSNLNDGVCEACVQSGPGGCTLRACTLKAAIQQANAQGGVHEFTFGVDRVQWATSMPVITVPVVLDGLRGSSGRVILQGDRGAFQETGLRFTADGSVVRNVEMLDHSVALRFGDSDNHRVENAFIHDNRSNGIVFENSGGNTLGGDDPGGSLGPGNEISGNGSRGILIDGGGGSNVIQGNYIHNNATIGVSIEDAGSNRIGGPTAVPGTRRGNVISGNGSTAVELRGTACGANLVEGNVIGLESSGVVTKPNNGHGLRIDAGCSDGTLVGGVDPESRNVISGNTSVGILVAGVNVTIRNNYLGTSGMGTSALGNRSGISISGTGHVIGPGNVISGNEEEGIRITSTTSTPSSDITIAANRIGTNAAGRAAVGNGREGIRAAGDDIRITDNLISGNQRAGVSISGIAGFSPTSRAVIQRNYVGTDVDGELPLGNAGAGVSVSSSSDDVITDNVVSANGSGISLSNANGGEVWSNFVGTNRTGTAGIGNSGNGISISGGVDVRVARPIGSDAPPNVVGSNGGHGVLISGTGETGHIVAGNLIGTNASGADLGNEKSGVYVSGASRNRIGSRFTAGNVIAFNDGDGVLVIAGRRNEIVGNSIHRNGGLGINLDEDGSSATTDGVTANDPLDEDGGSNDLQNFPTILLVAVDQTRTLVSGELQSRPSQTYYVEIFASADEARVRQGESLLGSVEVATDEDGRGVFAREFDGLHERISLTATDAEGNTSEFSNVSALVVNTAGDEADTAPGDGTCDVGGADISGRPPCTLRAAIMEANAREGADEILFNIPEGMPTIRPGSALPPIIEAVTLDATTQPGYAGAPIVELAGTGIQQGIVIVGGGSTVRGLAVTGFSEAGIHLDGAFGNTVEACYLGTNGSEARGNHRGLLLSSSSSNTIGGSGAGNVISGNVEAGIAVIGGSSNAIRGNLIGVGPNQAPMVNIEHAVHVSGGATDVTIGDLEDGNTIYGGVTIVDNATAGITVQGNRMDLPELWTETLRLPLRLNASGPACHGWEEQVGPNGGIAPPRLLSLAPGLVEGMTRPGSVVEVYRVHAAGTGRGRYFPRTVEPAGHGRADGKGFFRISVEVDEGDVIAAIATDPAGNSSELSQLKRHVIVAPGIGGSWLEAPDGSNLWIPTAFTDKGTNDLLSMLSMNPDGSNRGGVTAHGVLEFIPPEGSSIPVVDFLRPSVYGDLFKSLEDAGFPGERTTWLNSSGRTDATDFSGIELWRFANDWRLDQLALAEDLKDLIDWVTSANSPVARSCEVDLVSHSNGGVITSTYVRAFPEHSRDHVHRVVEIAVPYLGALQAFAAHTKGYIFEVEKSLVGFDPDWGRMIEMARNLTGAYTLLPSRTYWQVSSQFEVGSNALIEDLHGGPVSSFEAMRDFVARPKLQGGLGRNGPLWDAVLNRVHARIDDWRGWSGPPHIFRINGVARLGGVRGPTTAVGWTVDPMAIQRLANQERWSDFWPPSFDDWRVEPGDTPLHVTYRTGQVPIIGLGDGTVPLSSATLGRDPRAGRADYSGVDKEDGSPNEWIEDFVEYPCSHLDIVAETCADASGRMVVRHVEDILKAGHVVQAAGVAKSGGFGGEDDEFHVLYVSGTGRIGVHIEDEEGRHTGPSSLFSIRDVEYEIPHVGYWPNEFGVVVALPRGPGFRLTILAPDSASTVRTTWMMGRDGEEARQLLFEDKTLARGGMLQANVSADIVPETASIVVDADGDGVVESTFEAAAVVFGPAGKPAIPKPSPLILDAVAAQGAIDEPRLTVTLPASNTVWAWTAATGASWIAPHASSGTTPDSLILTLGSSSLEAGMYRDTVSVTLITGAYTVDYLLPVRLIVEAEAGALAQIMVEPPSVVMDPGSMQQFTAAGFDASGGPVPIAPSWSATGGTIDADGFYQAGASPGEYMVTASASGVDGTASVTIRSSVSTEKEMPPDAFALHPNFPNPFSSRTLIRFDVSAYSRVSLRVFDAIGREIATLADGAYAPGRYEASFDAAGLPSGLYYYAIRMGDYRRVRPLHLVR